MEETKDYIEENNTFNGWISAAGFGGAVGAIAHDLVMNPCDTVKQRLQVRGSPYVNISYSQIVRQIYHNEGLKAFYLSFTTQLMMNIPFAFIQFWVTYLFLSAEYSFKTKHNPTTVSYLHINEDVSRPGQILQSRRFCLIWRYFRWCCRTMYNTS